MKIIEKIEQMIREKKSAAILILMSFFLLVAWLSDRKDEPKANANSNHEALEIDTYIPSGFVLVPITIQNLESLDSIVGQYAVVDIYGQGDKSPLGSALRLVRSPKDPSQFAVLVPEADSREVVSRSHEPFQVVVQNPNQTDLAVRKSKKAKRISWED